jgi:hypothetical protein
MARSWAHALAFLLILLIAPPEVRAEGAAPNGAGGLAQVKLTEGQVTGFIESFPQLRALGEKYDATERAVGDSRNPASAFAGMLKNEAAMRELNEVLHGHDFADFNEWAQVAYSIMIAHNWKGDDKGPAAQLDKAIEQIRSNKQLGDEQKEALISRIEAQKGMVAVFTPDPENISLVSRYSEQIDQAVEQGRPRR